MCGDTVLCPPQRRSSSIQINSAMIIAKHPLSTKKEQAVMKCNNALNYNRGSGSGLSVSTNGLKTWKSCRRH
jgi:hypothetical protein